MVRGPSPSGLVYRAVLTVIGVIAVLIVAGSIYVNTNVEEINGCGLSYYDLTDYQFTPQPRPSSVHLPSDDPNRKHSYKLYRFVEPNVNRNSVHSVPVLFVHGNSGHYRQMRLIAMRLSSHRRSSAGSLPLALDYFSIDFVEEKSALSGRLTLRQSLYVNECVRTILAQYKSKGNTVAGGAPTQVLLIGHSMGGIIARSIFMADNFIPGSVSAIITLGTPHVDPFIVSDRQLQSFYHTTNQFWRDPASNSSTCVFHLL